MDYKKSFSLQPQKLDYVTFKKIICFIMRSNSFNEHGQT